MILMSLDLQDPITGAGMSLNADLKRLGDPIPLSSLSALNVDMCELHRTLSLHAIGNNVHNLTVQLHTQIGQRHAFREWISAAIDSLRGAQSKSCLILWWNVDSNLIASSIFTGRTCAYPNNLDAINSRSCHATGDPRCFRTAATLSDPLSPSGCERRASALSEARKDPYSTYPYCIYISNACLSWS